MLAAATIGGAVVTTKLLASDPASAADGDNLLIGQSNEATSRTMLQGTVTDGHLLWLQNLGTEGASGGVRATSWGGTEAVQGTAAGPGVGVWGKAGDGVGVLGSSEGTAGSPGVEGLSNSGPGVRGHSTHDAGVAGQSAEGFGVSGLHGSTDVPGAGVHGHSQHGTGVEGQSANGYGVAGHSVDSVGVHALGPGDGSPALQAVSGVWDPEAGAIMKNGGLALGVVGRAQFSTAGRGTVPQGEDSVFVAQPAVTALTHITVTLASQPGPRTLHWVEASPGTGFTVHLTPVRGQAQNEVDFTYLVVEAAS